MAIYLFFSQDSRAGEPASECLQPSLTTYAWNLACLLLPRR